MAIYTASVTGGSQFTGVDAATGLFNASSNTGNVGKQVRLNSVAFSTGGAITSWQIEIVDPDDSHSTVFLTDTTTDLVAGGPAGFMLLPTNADGMTWHFLFQTVGLDALATLKIDYDIVQTEG